MLTSKNELIQLYKNSDKFTALVEYTSGHHHFRTELIEKDYLCSIILLYLSRSSYPNLKFKGGTSLSKIHAGFYRMSEDLDFSISTPREVTRNQRRSLMKPYKDLVNSLVTDIPIFNLEAPLQGTNESRQYNATLSYQSAMTGTKGRILFEIALREEHLLPSVSIHANTLLLDQFTKNTIVKPFEVICFSKQEAYAEKIRAALTRKTRLVSKICGSMVARATLQADDIELFQHIHTS